MNRSSRNSRVGSRLRGLFVAAGALVVLATTPACVSSGKYEAALQERDSLAASNRSLQSEYESTKRALEADKSRLESETAALESEKAELERSIAEKEARMSGLDTELGRQKEEAARLKATYDGLADEMKNELEAGQVEIRQLRDGLHVDVSQEILFASGSAKLDEAGRRVLLRVSEQLKQTPYEVVVTGHTDNVQIGPSLATRYPTNWELAGARAASVVRLFEESGIDGRRLVAGSLGEHRPRDANDTEDGRARNRRIEVLLRPVVPADRG